jgi:hypothetical protein
MTMTRPKVDLRVAEKNRPRHGTEHGDAYMGNCQHPLCTRPRIVRADPFIVTQAGDLFHTACWSLVRAKDLSLRCRR